MRTRTVLFRFLWSGINRLFFKNLSLAAFIHPFARFKGRKFISIGEESFVHFLAKLDATNGKEGITVGKHCEVREFAQLIAGKGFVHMGDHSSVNTYSILHGEGGLTIGKGVRIGMGVMIVSTNHEIIGRTPFIDTASTGEGITIHDDVWIGANAVILDGTTIGQGTVVAAGAVVTSDTKPFTIVGGVPAKVIKDRN